jgi:hypothetical protein
MPADQVGIRVLGESLDRQAVTRCPLCMLLSQKDIGRITLTPAAERPRGQADMGGIFEATLPVVLGTEQQIAELSGRTS